MFDLSPLHHVLNWQVFYIDKTVCSCVGLTPTGCRSVWEKHPSKFVCLWVWRRQDAVQCECGSGRRPPFWKSLYFHTSAANRPNCTKFSMQTQILPQATETTKKIRTSQIQNGGWSCIKNHFSAITQLHICCPVMMKFGVRRQNHTHMKQVRWSNA